MPHRRDVTWRFYVAISFLLLIFLGLVGRLIYLNVVDRSFLLRQSQARILRMVLIPASRGMILDRHGTPLAISTPVETVWINPKEFQPSSEQLSVLSSLLELSSSLIAVTLKEYHHKEFMYLKRRVSPELAERVKGLHISGVHFLDEYKRFYPEGEVSAHVVGFTNVDDRGQEGLELGFNEWLAGVYGKEEVVKDRLGDVIADLREVSKPEPGHNLVLSLDQRIQYIAYRDLKEAVTEFHAKGGSVVVLDAKTGEILAMANLPSYNPNRLEGANPSEYRNRAVTDMFEPGSTIKPFTIALALESGLYTPESLVNVSSGSMKIGRYEITDHGKHDSFLNLKEILRKSSNVGAAKIMLSLSPHQYWKLLHGVGFGERTESQFPGEAAGRLLARTMWHPSEIAALAYGYGMSVTDLQLAKAYSIFANKGVLSTVSLVKRDHIPPGQRVLSEAVTDKVLSMLEGVTQPGGTGTRATVRGYRVAGKTGTAYMVGPNGYDQNRYVSSFVGLAPVSNPRWVVAVVVHEPQGKHFGAEVAAPIFSKIMGDTLRLLNVPPDSLEELTNS